MCVYTTPSIAWCGLTESNVNIAPEYIKISKFPLMKNGKAAIMLENDGFIKCITDKETNEILGFHIMGKNATELIAEPSFAMQFEATIEEIGATMHAHPTLYESIYEVALIALEKPLHG
jgi:dihydrolipoamide dehydrogenase